MTRFVGIACLIGIVLQFGPAACPAPAQPADPDNEASRDVLQRQELEVDGRPAFLILPKERKVKATPWVFYAPTLLPGLPGEAERWMFERFLKAGIAIAGVDVGESYGSPKGRSIYSTLHKVLVEEHGLAPRACLLARSRGGLMLYAWAADNPDKICCITGIYPVCNLVSYPGLEKACGAYGMTKDELAAHLVEHNPVDRLAPLAEAQIPLFHIHGDVDQVVPLEDNSGLIAKRYKELGGSMRLVVPKDQGHNMWPGFFECQELVDFLIEHATGPGRAPGRPIDELPAPVAHWKLDDTGSEAVDSAGKHHGTIHGATSAEGRLGRALLFDRSRCDHVSIPYSADFELSTFTVAAWVRLTKEPTFSGILGTRFGGEFTFDMKVNADKVHGDVGDGERWIETKVNFYAGDVGSNDQGGDLATGRWYHIAYVVDDDAKRFRLYLNGGKKNEIAYHGTPRLMKPGQTMRIGCSSSEEFMDGLIDDVQIWSEALSDQQVRTLAIAAAVAGGE